jgi:CO/xanthine dehydrogenase Mo-binding subunit
LPSRRHPAAAPVGIDPLEFRLINAYRDGDMKAHHQLTEGAALIECMQEASVWANWPVDSRVLRMSSREKRTG